MYGTLTQAIPTLVVGYLISLFTYVFVANNLVGKETSILALFVFGLGLLTIGRGLRDMEGVIPTSIVVGSLLVILSACINGIFLLGDRFKLIVIAIAIYTIVRVSK